MAKDKDKKGQKESQEQKAPEQARHSAKERPRLRSKFDKEVAPALLKELELKNVMAVPRLHKIVVNMGVGEATQNAKVLDPAVNELGQITGQKPVVTRAKKSIAAFKVRQGQSIGAMVTLRGDRMYEFLDRLVNIVLPRVRDFKGVSTKSFDGRGNFTLGLHDQLIFPEISYEKVDKQKGMNVTIVTTAATDNQARTLLKHLGMPFGLESRWARRPADSRRGRRHYGRRDELGAKDKDYGDDSETGKRRSWSAPGCRGREEAEVFDAQAQPLQVLRTSARVSAQVWHLPLVLPPARAARRDSRGFEVELVVDRALASCWVVEILRGKERRSG